MSGFRIDIDTAPVERLLGQLAQRARDTKPAMRSIGETLVASAHRNFRREQAPDGTPWKKSQRAKQSGGKTLRDSGRLRNSITSQADADRVEVGTNVIYAAIHQLGGRTRPHTIKPKRAKALFWPGAAHPVKSVQHPGSTIPARPFLGVSEEDWDEIHRILWRHLNAD